MQVRDPPVRLGETISGELISLDHENGVLEARKRRIILFSAITLAALAEKASQLFGEASRSIFYLAGIEAGSAYARLLLEKSGLSPYEALEELKKADALSGWGLYEYVSVDLERKEAVIRVWNSINARGFKKKGFKTCDFLRGYFAGFFSELCHSRLDCVETKCLNEGNEYCEFRVYSTA